MPYSFTQIEKEKSRVIFAAFCFLVFIYFVSIWIISLLVQNFSYFPTIFGGATVFGNQTFKMIGWFDTLTILVCAFIIAALHWFFTINGLVDRLIRLMHAQELDLNDPSQKMFQNIVEEVCVATGGKEIRGMLIPTMMLNACAFSDGKSVPVIAVTQGLLQKLNRSQLEAVVGHEAAHIISEDGEDTTIISAMFELFGGFLLGLRTTLEMIGDSDGRDGLYLPSSGRGRGSGGGGAQALYVVFFVVVIICIIWVTNTLGMLMRMFISRQREYRADATAVQLTRNPLALAEALYIIDHRRHSMYQDEDALQTLFIVNPSSASLNYETGFWADLFSTHPPIEERIKILLNMSFSVNALLDDALKVVTEKEEAELSARQKIIGATKGGLWYVQTPGGGWSGPHNVGSLLAFDWLKPDTKIKKMGETTVFNLAQIEKYMRNFTDVLNNCGLKTCPACGSRLSEIIYERIKILECEQCKGVLLNENMVAVILERKEKTFETRIQKMAQVLMQETQLTKTDSSISYESDRMYRCDTCQHNPVKMRKQLFNRFYPIEVDKCMSCGLIWFDRDELEIMQCIYETRNFNPNSK